MVAPEKRRPRDADPDAVCRPAGAAGRAPVDERRGGAGSGDHARSVWPVSVLPATLEACAFPLWENPCRLSLLGAGHDDPIARAALSLSGTVVSAAGVHRTPARVCRPVGSSDGAAAALAAAPRTRSWR